MNKKVAILSDIISLKKNLSKDLIDTYYQVKHVNDALITLGYDVVKLKFDLNLKKLNQKINKLNPLFIFNLVESEDKILLAPTFLESIKMPFTGASYSTIVITTNKVIMKNMIIRQNNKLMKTPIYIDQDSKNLNFKKEKKFIIKPIEHHSSINILGSSIINSKNSQEVKSKLKENKKKNNMNFFAEEYIDGREFNVAVLNNKILPVQEIEFINYPEEKPKIVCYKAKWDENSFEYQNTPRKYDFIKKDKKILDGLIKSSLICMELFKLDSYARIDYRVNKNGVPYIIDINANPCLSTDSGFFAACQKNKMTFENMIKEIIDPILKNININKKGENYENK